MPDLQYSKEPFKSYLKKSVTDLPIIHSSRLQLYLPFVQSSVVKQVVRASKEMDLASAYLGPRELVMVGPKGLVTARKEPVSDQIDLDRRDQNRRNQRDFSLYLPDLH